VALGVPGRLRSRIFLTFGTTRVEGRQPYAPATFTAGEIPATHFQGLSRPQGTWFRRRQPRKKSPAKSPGIDPRTSRLAVQCLNHYATPGKCTKVFIQSTRYTCQIVTKVEFSNSSFLDRFSKNSNTKFHQNPSRESRVVP
jgi:hypothetical protein